MIVTDDATLLQYNQLNISTASLFNGRVDLSEINRHFETGSMDELLEWALATFDDKVAQVTSFGPTGMVILDHLAKLSPGIRVITLDTEFLFDETYALWEEVQRRYSIQLEVHRPDLSPEEQSQKYGPKLWTVSANWCCYLRKVVLMEEALKGLDAWITGLRRDQSVTRSHLPPVAWDAKYNKIKLNPMVNWNRSQVWSYILEHNVPYNKLHDQGYASISCTHCTRPTTNGADERSGRWQGLQKTECGIHLSNS